MDPRVKMTRADLAQQFTLSMQVAAALRANMSALQQARSAANTERVRLLARQNAELEALFDALQEADVAPSTQLVEAVREKIKPLQ
jgi:hypothetical protein